MIKKLMNATLVMITITCTSDRVIPADKVDSAFFLLVDRFKNSDSEEFHRGLEEFTCEEFTDDYNMMHERFKVKFKQEVELYIPALSDETSYEKLNTVKYQGTNEEENVGFLKSFKIAFLNKDAVLIVLKQFEVGVEGSNQEIAIMNIYKMAHLYIVNFSKLVLNNQVTIKLGKEFTNDDIFAKIRHVLKSQCFISYAHMAIAKNIKHSSLYNDINNLDFKHLVSMFSSNDFIQIGYSLCKNFMRSVYLEKINFEFEAYERLADSSEINNKKLYVKDFTKNLEKNKLNQIFNDNTKIYLQSYNFKNIDGEITYFKDRIEKCEGENNVIFFEINCFDYFYAAINDLIKYITNLPANKKNMAAQILQKKINILCNSISIHILELFQNIPEESKKKNHYNIYFLYDNKLSCSEFRREMSQNGKFHPLMLQEIELISHVCTICHHLRIKILWAEIEKYGSDVFRYIRTITYDYQENFVNSFPDAIPKKYTSIKSLKDVLQKLVNKLHKLIAESTETKAPNIPNRAHSGNYNAVTTHKLRSHDTTYTNSSPNAFATPFDTANNQGQTCFGQHARYYPTPFSQQKITCCHDVRSMNPCTPNTYYLCTQTLVHNGMGCAGQYQIQQPLYSPMQPQANQHWHNRSLHPTYHGCTHCVAYHPNQQDCGQFLPHLFASSSPSCVPIPNTAPITHQNATWQASESPDPLDYGQSCVDSQDNRSLPQQEFVINVPDQTQAFIRWTVDGQDTDDYSVHDLYIGDA